MYKTIILLLFFIVFFYSCSTTPVCIAPSTTPLNNKTIKTNYGEVEGEQSFGSLFSLWMMGTPDTDLIIQDALKKKGGNALINVRCYEINKYFILFSLTTFRIKGEAVMLETIPELPGEKKNEKK